MSLARELLSLGKRITDGEAQLLRLQAQLESLSPWLRLDVPLGPKARNTPGPLLGLSPKSWTKPG